MVKRLMTLDDWKIIIEEDKVVPDVFIWWLRDEYEDIKLAEAVEWTLKNNFRPYFSDYGYRVRAYCWRRKDNSWCGDTHHLIDPEIFFNLKEFSNSKDHFWRDYFSYCNAMWALWQAKIEQKNFYDMATKNSLGLFE